MSEEPTTRQIWAIQDLSGRLGHRISTARLRQLLPTREDASRAMEKLRDISSREAEKINALPVTMRAMARKQMTTDDLKEVFGDEQA